MTHTHISMYLSSIRPSPSSIHRPRFRTNTPIPTQHHNVYLAVPLSALVNPVRTLAPTVLNEYLFAQLLP